MKPDPELRDPGPIDLGEPCAVDGDRADAVVLRPLPYSDAEQLVADGSPQLPDVEQTLWTLHEGGSFGVTYVFRSEASRAESVRRIRAEGSPIATILGHSADAIEEFDVLAISRGAE